MGQIGRADANDFLVLIFVDNPANRVTQRHGLLSRRDDNGQYLRTGEQILHKRDLHFDTMLGPVGAGIADDWAGSQYGIGQLLVNGNLAERRYPTAPVINCR